MCTLLVSGGGAPPGLDSGGGARAGGARGGTRASARAAERKDDGGPTGVGLDSDDENVSLGTSLQSTASRGQI